MNYDDLVGKLLEVFECGNGECGLGWSLELPRDAADAIKELQRDALLFADAVERTAFDIPPVNPHTPRLALLVVEARRRFYGQAIDEAMQRET